MMQAHTVTTTAVAKPLSELKNWAAIRGLKGVQLQAVASGVFYGGNNAQPLAVPDALATPFLPVAHLKDLYLRGVGTVHVVCYL